MTCTFAVSPRPRVAAEGPCFTRRASGLYGSTYTRTRLLS